MKKLYLLDAYALIFRAYFAFIKNPRFNSQGLNTSATLGFTNTLIELIKKEKPTHIAVVFDPPTPNFRKQLFPEYKSQRPPTPEDLIKSVPYIKQIIEAFNIPVIEIDGFEADDTIGTLAKQAEKEGFTVFMVTPDKDFGQLVSNNIFIYKPAKGGETSEIIGKKEILEKYKIEKPEQVIDILAIWGDVSDNIPGIPGVGEKTAIKLISEFKSAENLLLNSHKLKGKLQENVIKSKNIVPLSKTLATISLDVPVIFDSEFYKHEQPNYLKLESIFIELDFRALIKRIIPETTNTISQGELFPSSQQETQIKKTETNYSTFDSLNVEYKLIDSLEKRNNLIQLLNKNKEICFDTETTDINAHEAELVGISFCVEEKKAYYVPIPENKKAATLIINDFKELFENKNIKKIGQNLKYDCIVLKNYNIEVEGDYFDTMIAHYLLESDQKHNLNYLSETFFNYSPIPIENLIGTNTNSGVMRGVEIEKIKNYACEDADFTFRLKNIFQQKLIEENLLKLAEEIEFPLIKVLVEMECNGVSINKEELSDFEKELKELIKTTEISIFELAGSKFNISSPKQLGEILFEKLKITDAPKLTKTKQYATGEEELVKLKNNHEIIPQILLHRTYSKLLNTYVSSLPLLLSKKTGKLHTSFNQAITSTGRLSSSNPNLQNIPIKTLEGQRIRKCFVPSFENYSLISADYSQIELRVMAHLSNDEGMINAFLNNEDIHTATASKIYKVPIESVTKTMRNNAKSANFGIIYGISSFGLSQNLSITRSEANTLITEYFNSYPKVKIFMDNSIENARQKGFVVTLFDRKRKIENINSNNSLLAGNAARNAINTPVQGTAADIIKISMIKCYEKLKIEHPDVKMILQVHDELVFETPTHKAEEVAKIIKNTMENAIELSIPIIAESKFAKTWFEAH